MKFLFVSNPSSGSADEDVQTRIMEELRRIGDVTSFVASSADAFEDELRAAAGASDTIVVAGGDGTFTHVVNALAERRDEISFGLIPLGTGNDLARTLGVDADPEAAAKSLATAATRDLDLGRVSSSAGERFFVNACVGGFSVAVDEVLEEETKRKLGRFAFWLGGLRAATDIERYRVRVAGREIDDVVVVGIGNGRTVAGGLELWPNARPDDGRLEASVISAPELTDGIRTAVRVRTGDHEGTEGVIMMQEARFEVVAEPPMELNVDGELVGVHTPLTVDIAGTFRVLAPTSTGP